MKTVQKVMMVGAVTLGSWAVAQQVQRTLNLVINGKSSAEKAIVVNGKTYIPASELRAMGFTVTATGTALTIGQGGANGAGGSAGCANETLFNGLWRFTLLGEMKRGDEYGAPTWYFDAEVRNGTREAGRLDWAGLRQVNFVYADGRVVPGDARDFSIDIAPGAASRGRLTTVGITDARNLTERPVKLLLVWDETVRKDANLRFDLTCTR